MSWSSFVVLALALLLGGCRGLPGRPSSKSDTAPDQVRDFATLYANNCAGCHGRHGKGGAAIALDSAVYLSIAKDSDLRGAISHGVPHTPMPAFGHSDGGSLGDAQITALVKGIRNWASSKAGVAAPPYKAQSAGDAQRGALAFQTFCASCHGQNGEGGNKAGSIVDPSYLALVSDQYLRTVVIAGRPELGAPDWRGDLPGRPMTDQEVSDVVAWLAAHRTRYPGQPYPTRQQAKAKGEDK